MEVQEGPSLTEEAHGWGWGLRSHGLVSLPAVVVVAQLPAPAAMMGACDCAAQPQWMLSTLELKAKMNFLL